VRKFLKIFVVFYLFFLTSLISAWSVFHLYNGDGKRFGVGLRNFIRFFVHVPGEVNRFIINLKNGDLFMPPEGLFVNNDTLKDGFTIYDSLYKVPEGLNLLVSTFNFSDKSPVIKLIDLNTLGVKYKWVVDKSSNPNSEGGFFSDDFLLEHPLLVKNKSIIAHNNQFLFRIDSSGKLVWRKDLDVHHSIEGETNNEIWVCGNKASNKSYLFLDKDQVPPSVINKVDINNGKILFQKSIFDILIENGYDYIITFGIFEKGMFHINDIQPALYSTEFWEKGDLLISLRNRNTVFLYRPSTNKIIWLKTGPWSNQHDCDFIGNNQILVFGNDVLRRGTYTLLNGHNNAYIYDFRTDKITTPFLNFFKSSIISTKTEGRCDILPDGNLIVEETENGRILLGDTNSVKLIYVERQDRKKIQSFNWLRVIKDDEISDLK
jgi:hypothetical protein